MGLKKVIKKIKKHVDRALDYVKDKTVNAIAWATGEKHKAEKEANKLKRETNAAREAHENSMALIKKQQEHTRMLTNMIIVFIKIELQTITSVIIKLQYLLTINIFII